MSNKQKNLLNILEIKKIRQIINKPYKAFFLSMSEFELMQKTIMFVIFSFLIFEVFFGSIIIINGYLKIGIIFLLLLIFLIIVKRLQKRYGEGVIFFLLKDIKKVLKAKSFDIFKKNRKLNIESSLYFKES